MSLRNQWLLSILIVLLTAAWWVGRDQDSSPHDVAVRTSHPADVSVTSTPVVPAASATKSPSIKRLLPAVRATTTGPHAFLHKNRDGKPVTWSPCAPIRYVINDNEMPANGRQIVTAAVNEISAATGLQFALDPAIPDPPDFPPVQIKWQTDKEFPTLAGDVAGATKPLRVDLDQTGTYRYVGGEIALDADLFSELARNGAASDEQAIVMHELGHLVGLDHVNDPAEIMYPDEGALHLGPGDLQGLAELGSGTCTP